MEIWALAWAGHKRNLDEPSQAVLNDVGKSKKSPEKMYEVKNIVVSKFRDSGAKNVNKKRMIQNNRECRELYVNFRNKDASNAVIKEH